MGGDFQEWGVDQIVPKYSVEFPVFGVIRAEVQADSNKQALEKARSHNWKTEDIEEWDLYDEICEGNVLHVSPNEASADEIEDDGEYDIE